MPEPQVRNRASSPKAAACSQSLRLLTLLPMRGHVLIAQSTRLTLPTAFIAATLAGVSLRGRRHEPALGLFLALFCRRIAGGCNHWPVDFQEAKRPRSSL